jgi:hypothetical protein
MKDNFEIPKYKLSTTKSVDKDYVLTFFKNFIVKSISYKKKESYILDDGSILIFNQDNVENFIFIEFHCNVSSLPDGKGVSFLGITLFIGFCNEINSKIKTLRNKQINPASEGAIMSDFKWSDSFKKALHSGNHPKDIKKNDD